MLVFPDQTGRMVVLPSSPQRIISLVPSQTELLSYLGLNDRVVGITKFCIHPDEWFHTKARVGGTKSIHTETIHALQPDLIIANREENEQEQIEFLEQDYPVWISDIADLDRACDMIRSVGDITATSGKANELVSNIHIAFGQLPIPRRRIRAAYFIWKNPYMVAGGGTFIHDMLQRSGFDNVFGDIPRYPITDISTLSDKHCDVLLLSSEPFPFKSKHADELSTLLPQCKAILTDGEYFSWYGSRLLGAPAYFTRLLQSIGG